MKYILLSDVVYVKEAEAESEFRTDCSIVVEVSCSHPVDTSRFENR